MFRVGFRVWCGCRSLGLEVSGSGANAQINEFVLVQVLFRVRV